MGKVRPFVEEDIPEVVRLRQKSFRYSDRPTSDQLAQYFCDMFLRAPWRDEELPSLVYDDATGRPVGFVGVFPRRMVAFGEPIRSAVTTQFMVDREHRGTVALELLRRVFRGVQDISLADAAADVTIPIWERLGGYASLLYSLHWTRPLRPFRHAAASLGSSVTQRAMRLMLRPLLNLGDGIATRYSPGSYRQTRPTALGEELTIDSMLEYWPSMRTGCALTPEYDRAILEFVLQQLALKQRLGRLQRILVREPTGSVVGWYMYYLNVGGVGEVVHIAGVPGRYADVFDHLVHHAWRRGVVALRGRLEPNQASLLARKQCYLSRDGGWTAVQSRRPELLAAVQRGDATISRLDAEFWMTF